MSNAQKDILQIIRKEEDQAMSLLAASPLLSSLFLTYANRAAALDGPPTPSPIDEEWSEMKALNTHLQEEVASLRAQLEKETDRANTAEDCVEAFRAQIASLKDANRDLEEGMSDERTNLRMMSLLQAKHEKEAASTIAELRSVVEKEAVSNVHSLREITQLTSGQGARAALSQVIADQQISLAQLKEKNESPSPLAHTPPNRAKPPRNGKSPANVKNEGDKEQAGAHKQQDNPEWPKDTKQQNDAKREKTTRNLDDEKTLDTPESKDILMKSIWGAKTSW